MIGSRQDNKRGFIILVTAVSLIVLVGMLGLAVDLGRVYIVKDEAQAFTDLAAIAAARHLDGKQAGIDNANAEVASSINGWNFGTQNFPAAIRTVEFGKSSTGPWFTAPSGSLVGYAYVRVTVNPVVDLSFLPATGSSYTQTVTARSVAGVVPASFPLGGYMPFTPFAHNGADPNFGYTIGQEYSFRWPGNATKGNSCAGDQVSWPMYNFSDTVGGSTRGYFELQSASSIADAILGGKQTLALAVGDVLNMTNGNKQSEENALTTRASYDTDLTNYSPTPGTAPAYTGNGMRLVVMPVNSGPAVTPAYAVLGFASFLLPISYPAGGNKTWCAIYMGSSTAGGDGSGGPFDVAGAYVVRLVQ
jgi:putative Flp pilus-assembly TadE/G-like protein